MKWRVTGIWPLLQRATMVALTLSLGPASTCTAAGLKVQVDAIDVSSPPNAKAYVTVLDSSGEAVKGLKKQSFALQEQLLGTTKTRQITDFTVRSVLESGQKLAIALVIDRSGSMRGQPLRAAKEAVIEFLSRLSEGDQVALLSFASSVRTDCGFTADHSRVRSALDKVYARGDTALYDAARAGVNAVAKAGGATRKAVVLLTDGRRTTGSVSGPGPVASAAKKAGVRLFTVGLGRDPEHDVLEKLSGQTGGTHFEAGTPHDLLSVYQRIADRLQNQYVVAFNRPQDIRFYELTVRVVYGTEHAAGSKKFRPTTSDEPPPLPPGGQERGPDGGAPYVKVAVAVVGGLIVVILFAIAWIVRRRHVT